MWTNTTRAHHARVGLALPTDLTDAEWAVLEPLLPPPSSAGCPRKWPLRHIVEAILYLRRFAVANVAAVFSTNVDGSALVLSVAQQRSWLSLKHILLWQYAKLRAGKPHQALR